MHLEKKVYCHGIREVSVCSSNWQQVRIPDVCAHFNVPCINLKQLLVALGAKL